MTTKAAQIKDTVDALWSQVKVDAKGMSTELGGDPLQGFSYSESFDGLFARYTQMITEDGPCKAGFFLIQVSFLLGYLTALRVESSEAMEKEFRK